MNPALIGEIYTRVASPQAAVMEPDSMLMVSHDVFGNYTTTAFASGDLTEALSGIEKFLRDAGFNFEGRLTISPPLQ